MIGISKKRNLPSHFRVENMEEILGGNRKFDNKNNFKNRKPEPQNMPEYNNDNSDKSQSNAVEKTTSKEESNIIQLSVSQREVLLSIMEKKCVFFTGSAGMGQYFSALFRFHDNLLKELEKVTYCEYFKTFCNYCNSVVKLP